MFLIEDDVHAEWVGQFETLEAAQTELKRIALLPWGEAPNRAPCTNHEKCERDYGIIEYDTSTVPWNEVKRYAGMKTSAEGVKWD